MRKNRSVETRLSLDVLTRIIPSPLSRTGNVLNFEVLNVNDVVVSYHPRCRLFDPVLASVYLFG